MPFLLMVVTDDTHDYEHVLGLIILNVYFGKNLPDLRGRGPKDTPEPPPSPRRWPNYNTPPRVSVVAPQKLSQDSGYAALVYVFFYYYYHRT